MKHNFRVSKLGKRKQEILKEFRVDRKNMLLKLLNFKVFGQTYPTTLCMINAIYALTDSPNKKSMLLEFLKHSLDEIHSLEIKKEDYNPIREKITKLNDKIEAFLARLSHGKTYDQIEARVKESDLSQLD